MSYQFKITLDDTDPIVWRRVQVPKHTTFYGFALAIQDAMQWYGIKLYRFIIDKQILVPDYDNEEVGVECHVNYVEDIINSEEITFEY